MENEGDTTEMISGIHQVNEYLAHMGVVYDLHPWKRFLSSLLHRKTSVAVLVNYTLTQIAKHRTRVQVQGTGKEQESGYESFLKKLLDMEKIKKVTLSNIMDACGSNIGAGSDTTAITLSAALFYLYQNPEKLSKLRHEIDTQASKGCVSDPVTFQEAQGSAIPSGSNQRNLAASSRCRHYPGA